MNESSPPENLRRGILRYLQSREREPSGGIPGLEEIAYAVGASEDEVGDQVDILEAQGAVKANRTFRGAWPLLTGHGKALLEPLEERAAAGRARRGSRRTSNASSKRARPEWDVFICHASEDKNPFVDGLAEGLRSEGVGVWYDTFTLRVGDSLRRSIDKGLANSRYGIVVLSHNFFAQEWPQKELDGLTTRERDGEKVILPVWLDLGANEVSRYSPMLADRVAARASEGLRAVVRNLLAVLGAGGPRTVGSATPVKKRERFASSTLEAQTRPEEASTLSVPPVERSAPPASADIFTGGGEQTHRPPTTSDPLARRAAQQLEAVRGRARERARLDEERRAQADSRSELLAFWADRLFGDVRLRVETLNRALGESAIKVHSIGDSRERRCQVSFLNSRLGFAIAPLPVDAASHLLLWGKIDLRTPARLWVCNLLLVDTTPPYGSWNQVEMKIRGFIQRGASPEGEDRKGGRYEVLGEDRVVLALNWQALLFQREMQNVTSLINYVEKPFDLDTSLDEIMDDLG